MEQTATVPTTPFITLNSGHNMPQIGLGTFKADEGNLKDVVKAAILEHGYRHIDTAKIYGNEALIGEALQECFAEGIKREELFITTKLWPNEDKCEVEASCRAQLKSLQLEYIDLFLIHWMIPLSNWEDKENPIKPLPTHKVWEEMEKLVDLGLVKSIGVSNCSAQMLYDILSYARIKPAVNQIELHPYLMQKDLVRFSRDRLGVNVTAYAPLGASAFSGKNEAYNDINLLKEPIINEIAAKHSKSVGQVLLNWHVHHRGHIVIPKTSKIERLRENLDCLDFKLTEEEYAQIDALDCGVRFFDPVFWDNGVWQKFPYFDQNCTKLPKL